VLSENNDRRIGVRTSTIEDQLAEVRRRIDALRAADGAWRFRRHVDIVADVEQKLAQLKTRLDVAERSLAADVSGDWATFSAAVESELESWDTYLERLQTTVATRASHTRQRAETAIADVRSLRIAVGERLTEAGDGAADGWQEQRERVGAARDELEQKADELSAKLT
jgi:DNA repair exonuclease SbcCD ATPase subunit